jgi:telomere length regulation protein
MATAVPPLSTLLSSPLSSTTQLLAFLVPPLARLGLVADQPQLVAEYPSPDLDINVNKDTTRFLKRQLALVQKVLVERVWPDWEAALEAEEGQLGELVLERWFVPPSLDNPIHAEVAFSSYAVLSSLLSPRTKPPLQPRSVEIVLSLLVKLSSTFGLEQAYLAIFGRSSTGRRLEDAGADAQDAERWERVLKDLVSVPTKVANAWGSLTEAKAIPQGRVGDGIPAELEWR